MAKKKPETTVDSIDIKDKLEGSIADVIAALQGLQKEYPKGDVEVTTENRYGDTYVAARLNFTRDKTPLEIEIADWDAKARQLHDLRAEANSFERNGVAYPRASEIEELRRELGFFAMAPMRATLTIFEDEILVWDHMRGGRRRDGTFVFKTLMGSSELDRMYEEADKAYVV